MKVEQVDVERRSSNRWGKRGIGRWYGCRGRMRMDEDAEAF